MPAIKRPTAAARAMTTNVTRTHDCFLKASCIEDRFKSSGIEPLVRIAPKSPRAACNPKRPVTKYFASRLEARPKPLRSSVHVTQQHGDQGTPTSRQYPLLVCLGNGRDLYVHRIRQTAGPKCCHDCAENSNPAPRPRSDHLQSDIDALPRYAV